MGAERLASNTRRYRVRAEAGIGVGRVVSAGLEDDEGRRGGGGGACLLLSGSLGRSFIGLTCSKLEMDTPPFDTRSNSSSMSTLCSDDTLVDAACAVGVFSDDDDALGGDFGGDFLVGGGYVYRGGRGGAAIHPLSSSSTSSPTSLLTTLPVSNAWIRA